MADPWTLLAAAVCGAICWRIVSYRPASGSKYRLLPALCAWLLAVGTGCFSLSVWLDALYGRVAEQVSPFLLIILVVLAVLVFRARGNVALVTRLSWGTRWDGEERRNTEYDPGRRMPRHD